MNLALSVIIPTRNRADVLRQSLPRVFDQTMARDAYEIIVVDDASEDDTGAVVRGFDFPGLRYIRLAERSSSPAARNRAIEAARGEALLFLDDDAFVARDFLAAHLDTLASRRDACVTGPIVEVSEIPPPMATPPPEKRGRHLNPFPGGNVSVMRQTILDVGGFDESFRIYGWADPELSARLQRRGLKGVFTWRAPIYHYKAASVRNDLAARLAREERRGSNGALFYAKHPRFPVAMQTKQAWMFRALDALLDPLLGLERRTRACLAGGAEPASPLIRLLMLNHMEIAAGRRALDALGPERRRALGEEAAAFRNGGLKQRS